MAESNLSNFKEENITALEITPLVAIALVLVHFINGSSRL